MSKKSPTRGTFINGLRSGNFYPADKLNKVIPGNKFNLIIFCKFHGVLREAFAVGDNKQIKFSFIFFYIFFFQGNRFLNAFIVLQFIHINRMLTLN